MIQHNIVKKLLLLALLWPTQGWSSDQHNWQASASYAGLHFDYREFNDSGRELNREQGFIPGIAINLQRNWQAWRLSSTASYHQHDIDYQDNTQAGVKRTSTSNAALYNVNLQLSHTWPTSAIRLYGELGYRLWNRDISSTQNAQGLEETYRWSYFAAGAELPIRQFSWGSISLDAKLTQHQQTNITVNSHGLYDNKTLSLGNNNGFRIALPIIFNSSSTLQFLLTPYWEEYSFGRSNTETIYQNGVIAGNIHEPRSETKIGGINIGINKRF